MSGAQATTVEQILIACITLFTALVGALVHYSQSRADIAKAKQAAAVKHPPLRLLSMSHGAVFDYEREAVVHVQHLMARTRWALIGSVLVFVLYLSLSVRSVLFYHGSSAIWDLLGIVDFVIAVILAGYVGWTVVTYMDLRHHLHRLQRDAAAGSTNPFSHKSRMASADVMGDYITVVDRCINSLHVLRMTPRLINRDEGVVLARHGHYPLIFLYDDVTIKISKGNGNQHHVEVISDGIRPTFGSDERRNSIIAARVLQQVLS